MQKKGSDETTNMQQSTCTRCTTTAAEELTEDNESQHQLTQSIKPQVANLSHSCDLDQALIEIAKDAVDRVQRGGNVVYDEKLLLGAENNEQRSERDSLKLHREKFKNRK